MTALTLAAKIDARLHDCAAPKRTAIIAEVIQAAIDADNAAFAQRLRKIEEGPAR